MGTEVLRPQDCLIDRIRVGPAVFQHHRRRNFQANGNGSGNGIPNPSRKPAVRAEQKKNNGRSGQLASRRSASLDNLRKSQSHNPQSQLVMGQVMILRRGESLDSKLNGGDHRHRQPVKKASDDLVVCGTERLGPDPEIVPKQIRIFSPVPGADDRPDVYAGSAFSMSPSPRSLPLPSFFSKKQVSKVAVDDSATRDLRRLLRLD